MLLRGMVCAGVLLLAATSAAETPPAAGEGQVGSISGRVLELGGSPIAYATVMVLGTKLGATTDEKGAYLITGVPVGNREVRALLAGRESQTLRVAVDAGGRATLEFHLREGGVVRELPEVVVEGRKTIDVHTSSSHHEIEGKELRSIPGIDNVVDALALKAGVVVDATGVHVRGGRAEHVKTLIDGIEMTETISGAGVIVADVAVASAGITTGAMEADKGNALSGVISVSTREGSNHFGGDLRWDTDRFGDPTKTFDNLDRLSLGFGGPTPVRDLTYFATYEGTFENTYLRTSTTQPRRTVWDFIRLGNRQRNQINANFKLAYRINSRHKVTLESIQNRTIFTPYEHMWSRQGYVQVNYDTIRAAGNPDVYQPRFGAWSYTRTDSTYQPVNMPDHVPTENDRFGGLTAVWTNQLSDRTVWTARASAMSFAHLTSIGRKKPWDYWIESPQYWDGNTTLGTERNIFFATHGDFPNYAERNTSTWVVKSDLSTARWKQHTFKAGVETRYNRVQNLLLVAPNGESRGGLPGAIRSDFLNYHPEGAAYLLDRWEYEGLVLNAGLRYDVFTPGDQVSLAELTSGKRFKQQLSPRLGVAYPISDKDALSFFYGWTYQTPGRSFLFENRGLGATVGIQGNPDLEPETDVSYQAAIQHLFSKDVSGQFAVFFQDIYGLIATRATSDQFGNQISRFVNRDYASSRGFEATIAKSFSHKFSAEANYTYQIATGVASDPRQAQQFIMGGRLYLPISEQPLDWDQRSTFSLRGLIRDPGRWGLSFLWRYGSGRPFTPTFRNDRAEDPVLANSRRLPATSTLTIDGDRYFKIWGQAMTLFVEARNVLDAKNLASLSQSVFPNPFVIEAGDSYLVYYTETGRAGGAYLQDVNGDNVLDWIPVRDPRVFQEGRNVRMGLSLAF
jgi:outer membrane receptor protein involved in Fe transport